MLKALLVSLAAFSVMALDPPGVGPRSYAPNERLELKVNVLTSNKMAVTMDFCESEYEFFLYQEEACKILCRKVYSKLDVAKFKTSIDENYTVNVMADGLPAATHEPIGLRTTTTYLYYDRGFPVGRRIRPAGNGAPNYYLSNHLRITVYYNMPFEHQVERAYIVGLEVEPFSINHETDKNRKWDDANPPALCQINSVYKLSDGYPMEIDPDSDYNPVVWTYDVRWESSETKWPNRWDPYVTSVAFTETPGAAAESAIETAEGLHLFSNSDSLLIVLFLGGMVALSIVRSRSQPRIIKAIHKSCNQ